MNGEALKEPNRFRVLDIAAVDDEVDIALLQHLQDIFDGLVTAVGVAEDGNLHESPTEKGDSSLDFRETVPFFDGLHHAASERPAKAFTSASTKKWSPQA